MQRTIALVNLRVHVQNVICDYVKARSLKNKHDWLNQKQYVSIDQPYGYFTELTGLVVFSICNGRRLF